MTPQYNEDNQFEQTAGNWQPVIHATAALQPSLFIDVSRENFQALVRWLPVSP